MNLYGFTWTLVLVKVRSVRVFVASRRTNLIVEWHY